jgi:hypothetical protein
VVPLFARLDRRLLAAFFVLFGIVLCGSVAAQPATVQVVIGAGFPSPWVTEYLVGNVTPHVIFAEVGAYPEATDCVGPCTDRAIYRIDPNSTALVAGPPTAYPSAIAVYEQPGQAAVVRAWTHNSQDTSQSVELPVRSLDEVTSPFFQLLFAVGPRTLRGNLLLLNLKSSGPGQINDVTARIDVWSAVGQQVATKEVTLPALSQLYLVDLGRLLAVSSLSGCQIRVTRTRGDGALWGIVAEVSTEGRLSITTPVGR